LDTPKLKFKEKVGYAFGDAACMLVLATTSALLQKFYTDILHIAPAVIMVMFLIVRIFHAVVDPVWGRFIDTRKPSERGRYRKWILFMALPLSVSTLLMFIKIPGFSVTGYIVYGYITYALFGVFFTAINTPYGSLATVMTTDLEDRSMLSIFRSAGAGIGNVPAMLVAIMCYVTLQDGTSQMNYTRLIIGVIVISASCLLLSIFCYLWTNERIVHHNEDTAHKKGRTKEIVVSLFKSKSFVSLSIAAMIIVGSQMFAQAYYVYLFEYYFESPSLYMIAMICTYLPVVILVTITKKLVVIFGKKLLCTAGLFVAGFLNVLMYFVGGYHVAIFLVLCFFAGVGATFLLLQVWAMLGDVIDNHEKATGIREDGTTYSFFSFARKLGMAIAGFFSAAALAWIGYKVGADAVQEKSTIDGMYAMAVLIPAGLYFVGAVALLFFYPVLDKGGNDTAISDSSETLAESGEQIESDNSAEI